MPNPIQTALKTEWAMEGKIGFKGKEYDLKRMGLAEIQMLQERVIEDRKACTEILKRRDLVTDMREEEEHKNWRNKIRILITLRKNQLNAIVFELGRRKRKSRTVSDFYMAAIEELFGLEARTQVYELARKMLQEKEEREEQEKSGFHISRDPMVVKQSMCDGKIRHANKRIANEHIEQMKADGRNTTGLNCYQCPYCDGWHVGHRPDKSRGQREWGDN